ncbi:MAG TPA: cupredoxin domain-containing protein [Candidatus Limnocylindrales bacterium]|nr:cupredoxin domain-containing protein [Candidatus Limnocylindrales bacterium]
MTEQAAPATSDATAVVRSSGHEASVHAGAPSGWPFLLPLGVLVAVFGLALLQPVLLVGGVLAMLIPIVGWFRDAGHELSLAHADGPPASVHEDSGEPHAAGGPVHHGFPGPAFGLLVALVIVAAGATLSLNIGGSTAAAAGGSGAVASAANGPAQVDAKNIQFSVSEIDAAAGKSFEIDFRNDDASIPHNIAILDSSGSNALFRGDLVTGPASTTYSVPALPAGSYTFHCDVHPSMSGTVVVK